jgi:hypothetical protein
LLLIVIISFTRIDKPKTIIIDNIIEELDKKREVAINKKNKALLKDEVWKYGDEEDTNHNTKGNFQAN